jgi:hypothetical protein
VKRFIVLNNLYGEQSVIEEGNSIERATVRLIYFNLSFDRENFSVLIDIDTDEVYTNKSNWVPPSLDDDLCYSTIEEFEISLDKLGQREYKGNLSTEIVIHE